jgi:signal transduction histidine kinase
VTRLRFSRISAILVLALTYYAAAKLGLSMALVAPQVTAVWPPSGIAVAALILFGPRMWPGVMLGAFFANVTASEPVWTAIAISVGNTLEGLIAAVILTRFLSFDHRLERRRDVLELTFIAAVLSTVAAATLGAASLCATGVQPWQRFGAIWSVWWIGDAIGVMLVSPLLLTWSRRNWRVVRTRGIEALGLAILLLALTYSMFLSERAAYLKQLEYAVFPVVIWAAVRFGPLGVAAASGAIGSIAVVGTLQGIGPFAGAGNDSLIQLQLFMGVVAVTGLLLAAATRERTRISLIEQTGRLAADLLSDSPTLAVAAPRILHLLGTTLGWDTAAYWTVDQDARIMRREASWTSRTAADSSSDRTTLPLDRMDHLVVRAYSQRVTTWNDNVKTKSESAVAFLVQFSYRTFGVIELTKLDPRSHDQDLTGLLEEIGGNLAAFIERTNAAAQLKEADRRKDEFLAMLSHELRNPLAPIRNALHILKTSPFEQGRSDELIDRMSRQVDHLVHLVDDLLDTSRIIQGKIKLRIETVRLDAVIDHACEILQPVLGSFGRRLEVRRDPEPLWVRGDVTRLTQVFENLLHNAVKYSEPETPIRLSTEHNNGAAIVRIRDWGAGIEASHLPHIFDLFYQSDKSLERSQGGLGIGLTLVHHIVEMHGGAVEAHSAGQGEGSEFVVRLPIATPTEDSPEKSVTPPVAETANEVRILVVDDNHDAAETLCVFLEMTGYRPIPAYSGTEAMEAAQSNKPHVILLDIGLPGMNGYEVAAWVRKQPELNQTRLIAITGYGQEEDRLRCEQAGFNLHLVKPVDLDRLDAAIRSLLNQPT